MAGGAVDTIMDILVARDNDKKYVQSGISQDRRCLAEITTETIINI